MGSASAFAPRSIARRAQPAARRRRRWPARVLLACLFAGAGAAAGAQADPFPPSSLAAGSGHLLLTGWDRVRRLSTAADIDAPFVYVPVPIGSFLSTSRYSVAGAAPIGAWQAIGLADVRFATADWQTEQESRTFGDTETANGFLYTVAESFAYAANRRSATELLLSPGLLLAGDSGLVAVRYVFGLLDRNHTRLTLDELRTITFNDLTTHNVATTDDRRYELVLADGALVNGAAAGMRGVTDHGAAWLLDGYAAVAVNGAYRLSAETHAHLLDDDPVDGGGVTAPDGTTVDYITATTTWDVARGYLDFDQLAPSSHLFGGPGGAVELLAARRNGRFDYRPLDPTASLDLPTSVALPQVNLLFEGHGRIEGDRLSLPASITLAGGIPTAATFELQKQSITYTAADNEDTRTTTSETLALPQTYHALLGVAAGVIVPFGDRRVHAELGAIGELTGLLYSVTVARDLRVRTIDPGTTDTNQRQLDWIKRGQVAAIVPALRVPFAVVVSGTLPLELFAAATLRGAIVVERRAFYDTRGYRADCTEDFAASTDTCLFTSYQNAATDDRSWTVGFTLEQQVSAGVRYRFGDNLFITVQLEADSRAPNLWGLLESRLAIEATLRD